MSQCMDRKTCHGVADSIMGSKLTRINSSSQDVSGRCSNHIRCSTGLCSTVVRGTDNIAKAKTLTTFSSTGYKVKCRNPSTLFSASIDCQKRLPAQVNQSLRQKRVIAKRINGKERTEVPKCTHKQLETADAQSTPRTARIHELPSCAKDTDSANLQKLPEDGTGVLETCGAQGTRKQIKHRPGCGSLYAPTISSTQRLIASRYTKKTIESCFQGAGAGAKKCHWKNNNSSSISKVVPSGCSHSISAPCRRDNMVREMFLEGKSSALRTKSTSASSNRKLSGPLNTRLSTSTTLKALTMTNKSKINDHLAVVKPQEHSRRGTTRGLPAKENQRLSLREAVVSQVLEASFSILGAPGSSSRSLDNELPSTCHNVSVRKNFSGRNAPGRTTSSPALYMLESESNLCLGSLNYHDQHREMRMDIDNMSYEELLELEEKMGSVSTGLTDEALTKCLKRSNFNLAHSPSGITDRVEDGNRCSICQEEFADGDDNGALACEHWYHVVCIHRWLKEKNWCPICKSPACANNQLMAG